MANRLIGLEITTRTIRVAVLGQHRGLVSVMALEQRPYQESDDWPGLLEAMIPGGFQLTDRVGAALPAGQAYVRTLEFPFKERRKIKAAAPFELAARLPVGIEECQVVMLPPDGSGAGASIVSAAAPKANLEAFLDPFEQHRLPLQVVDLMPHSLAAGFGETITTGVLLCLNEEEVTLSLLVGGRVAEYRHFPLEGMAVDMELAQALLREVTTYLRYGEGKPLPVYLTGALATAELLAQLQEQGLPAQLFTPHLGHRNIPPKFVPAVAMALRLSKKAEARSFNLRQGSYAYRGEAAGLHKSLYGFGALLGASLLLFCIATGLGYRDKSRQAEALLKQMTREYQETFPGSTITVDVPLQMQSKLQELRNRAQALGIGAPPQVLPILKELSTVVAGSPYEVEELSCDEGGCSLSGKADSFDAVNRMKAQLEASPLFGKAEVAETRRGIDGERIDFRLRLLLSGKGGAS